MWVHNLDPVLISIGPLAIHWYGLVYALGFLFAYWYVGKAAKEKRIKLTPKQADDFVFWLIILSIVCARLAYVFIYNPAYYLGNPLKILAVWEGGLSFHGGLIGGVLAALLAKRRYGVSFYALADLLMAPFALALVFGRLANFVNGELPGPVTDVAWCVQFPGYDGCRHPSQLYEAGKNLIVFAVLVVMQTWEPIRSKLKEGVLFWTFVLLYGLGRFITDFWREPDFPHQEWFGIILGQWLSLVMVVVAGYFLMTIVIKYKNRG